MNPSSSSLQWQNVTFGRNWPISSGTVSTDSKFTETKSFKRHQKGTALFGICLDGGWFACSSRMSNPRSFAGSPFDNWSSIYSPVITSLVPAPCISHLFLVSLELVCFQLCSQLYFWSYDQKCISGAAVSSLWLVSRTLQWICSTAADFINWP